MTKIIVKIPDEMQDSEWGKSVSQFLERTQEKEVIEIVLDIIDESIEIKFADRTSVIGFSTDVINYEYNGIKF